MIRKGIQEKRVPLDPELYKAAGEGNTKLLEELLTSVVLRQHALQCEVAIAFANEACTGSSRARCLLGVTYARDTASILPLALVISMWRGLVKK